MKTVGSRLKAAREKKGWTQTYVCKKLGISNSTLSGYERDYRKPDPEQIRQFAELYEVSADYLLGRDNDSSLPKQTDNMDQKIDLRKAIMEREITWGDKELPKESQEALRKIILAVLEREGLI